MAEPLGTSRGRQLGRRQNDKLVDLLKEVPKRSFSSWISLTPVYQEGQCPWLLIVGWEILEDLGVVSGMSEVWERSSLGV